MDYKKFQNVGKKILTKFGRTSKVTLRKVTGSVYNSMTKKQEKTYEETNGIGVKLNYTEEVIGRSDNIIKAGDVRFIVQFSVEPEETKDEIIFNNDTFNIIHVKKIDPDATTVVIYDMQCRRSK